MRERALLAGGWLRIDAAPGRGTSVEVWVPALVAPEGASDGDSGRTAAAADH
jgi:hypothetical protein